MNHAEQRSEQERDRRDLPDDSPSDVTCPAITDLIEALTILATYQNPNLCYPTDCSRGALWVLSAAEPSAMHRADVARLAALGFEWCDEEHLAPEGGAWVSYRFGEG